MKKIGYIIVMFLILAIPTSVYGYGASGSDFTGGGGVDTTAKADGSSTTYAPAIGDDGYRTGIRVSFVNSDGRKIGEPVNYFTDSDYDIYNLPDKGLYYMNSKCSSVAYKAMSSCGNPGNVNDWKAGHISTIAKKVTFLDNIFKKNGFNVSVSKPVRNQSFPRNMFDDLLSEKHVDDPNYATRISNVMRTLFSTDFDEAYQRDIRNAFLIIEPLTVVVINGHYYLGTSYELSSLAVNSSGGGFVNEVGGKPCSGDSRGAYCDLISYLGNILPCTSYLDGNLAAKIKNKNIGNEIAGKFSSTSYFNGIVKINNSTYYNTCNSKGAFKTQQVTQDGSNKIEGIGIGVFWLGDFFPQKLSCDMVNNNLSSLPSTWQTAINNYNRFSGTHTYQNCDSLKKILGSTANINGQSFSGAWYFNECSCCGMYENFSTWLAPYIPSSTIIINTGQSAQLGNDWFTQLKMTDVKADVIGLALSGELGKEKIYIKKNADWQTYSEQHNLEWTPFSLSKYINLQCGSTNNYWCNEVETWIQNNTTNLKNIKSMTYSQVMNRKDEVLRALYAYNLIYKPANKLNWTVDINDEKNNIFAYTTYCKQSTPSTEPPPSTNSRSCDSINAFYKANNINLSGKSCNYLSTFNFNDYNMAYNDNVTTQWYTAICGCNEEKLETDCTPQYEVGNCSNGDNIYYSDSSKGSTDNNYWNNCVFNDNGIYSVDTHKESKTGANTYYDDTLGSKYCEVYCIETLSANFDGDAFVQAGRNFTWNNHTISGSRTCKTKSIDWKQFTSDLDAANDDIVDKYAKWQLEIKKEDSIAHAAKTPKSSICIIKEKEVSSTYALDENGRIILETCTGHCGQDDLYDKCGSDDGGKIYGNTKKFTKKCYIYGTRYKADSVSVTINGVTKEEWKWGGKSWCEGDSKPTTNITQKEIAYKNALNTANGYVNQMKSCYSNWEDNLYNVNPSLTVNYSNTLYGYEGQLKSDTSYDLSEPITNCTDTKVKQITNCSFADGTNIGTCSSSEINMQKCTSVEMTKSASSYFNIPSNVYRYVLKGTHESIMTDKFNQLNNSYQSQDKTFNYIDIGYGNFPVAYSTPDGTYEGQLSLTYTNLGHVKGNGKTAVDNILYDINSTDYGTWSCDYTVYSDLIKKDGDITVIYRPIDLNNPFPDTDASKRDTGDNWCGHGNNCSPTNEVVTSVITNNRNVKTEQIYNEEPMYTFILTPGAINEIRKYNRANSYDDYSGKLQNDNYDFVCDTGTNRHCISEYFGKLLRDYGTSYNNQNLQGACSGNDSQRKSNFDTCRTIK